MNTLKRNIYILYLGQFLGGLLFFLPIYSLYLEKNLFTLLNVGIISSVTSLTNLIFEVPTGSFADLFGRKNSLILGSFISVIGFIALGFATTIQMFILSAFLSGLARSLFSGTVSALMFDSLSAIKQTCYFKKATAIKTALWPLGATISSIIGGFLATYSLKLPIFLSIIPAVLATILYFFLKEPKYHKETHKNIFKHIISSGKTAFKIKNLFILVILSFLFSSFGSAFQLTANYFDLKNIPLFYFGILTSIGAALTTIGALFSDRISKIIGNKLTLFFSFILQPLLIFTSTFFQGLSSGIILILSTFFNGIELPVKQHLLNIEAKSKNRATILSLNQLSSSLGLAIFSPIVGYLADLVNLNFMFRICAGLIVILSFLLFFLKDRD